MIIGTAVTTEAAIVSGQLTVFLFPSPEGPGWDSKRCPPILSPAA